MAVGKEPGMNDMVSGMDHAIAVKGNAGRERMAEGNHESGHIVRKVMRSHAFREARMSLTHRRRHRHDATRTVGAERLDRHYGAGARNPARERKTGAAERKEGAVSIRVDAEALLESINFNEGSAEELISKGLAGKLKKAESNLVALEIGKLINCSAYHSGIPVEKQAASRETGLRLAEHFTQNYFGDPDKAKACMDRIKGFIERNEMLEKGYYFWEGQAYESYKPVPISIVYKLGGVFWSKGTVEKFRLHEKEVAETISKAKAAVADSAVYDKLAQIYAKFEEIRDFANGEGSLGDAQRILDIQSIMDAK